MTDTEKEIVRRNVSFPKELFKKTLVGPDGIIWGFKPRFISSFMSFLRFLLGKPDCELKPVGLLDASLESALKETGQKAIKSWLENDVKPFIQESVREAAPIAERALELGSILFRKEFLSKLGAQGERLWREILEEQFTEIGKLSAEQNPDKEILISSPSLPPGVRKWWRCEAGRTIVELFCFEFPPERKTVKFFGKFRRLAFPWLSILALFKNGEFFQSNSPGNRSAFWVFYRSQTLGAAGNEIYFPNLPHIWEKWPYMWCLGYSIPVITLEDPNWHAKLLDYFWKTEFLGEGQDWQFWNDAKRRIPEVASLEKWAELSETNPKKMLELSWKKAEFTLEKFAESVLLHFAKVKPEEMAGEEKARDDAKARLVSRFRERLEEELAFLGARLVIKPDLKKQAGEIMERHFAGTVEAVTKGLENKCRLIASGAAKTFLKTEEPKKGD